MMDLEKISDYCNNNNLESEAVVKELKELGSNNLPQERIFDIFKDYMEEFEDKEFEDKEFGFKIWKDARSLSKASSPRERNGWEDLMCDIMLSE